MPDTNTLNKLSNYADKDSKFTLNIDSGEEYLVVDTNEKYKVNLLIVPNKLHETIIQFIIMDHET